MENALPVTKPVVCPSDRLPALFILDPLLMFVILGVTSPLHSLTQFGDTPALTLPQSTRPPFVGAFDGWAIEAPLIAPAENFYIREPSNPAP